MPQFTIDLPEAVMPALARKAQWWNKSPEGFLSSYLVTFLETDAEAPVDARREALEDNLEERDKGPFVPVPDDLVERVMEKAMARIHGRKVHV